MYTRQPCTKLLQLIHLLVESIFCVLVMHYKLVIVLENRGAVITYKMYPPSLGRVLLPLKLVILRYGLFWLLRGYIGGRGNIRGEIQDSVFHIAH